MKRWLRGTLDFIRPYKILYFGGLFLGSAGSFLDVFIPKFIERIAGVIKDGTAASNMDFAEIRKLTLYAGVVIAVGFIANVLGTRCLAKGGKYVIRDLRVAMNDKTDRIRMNYFDTHALGDSLSRLTADVSAFSAALSSNIGTLVFSLIITVGCVIMMVRSNVFLAICSFVTIAAGLLLNSFITFIGAKAVREQRKLLGAMNAMVSESINGHLIIKSFNSEEEVLAQFDGTNEKMSSALSKSQFFLGILVPFMDLVSNLTYVVVCVTGASMIMRGTLEMEVLAAFILYIKMITSPITKIIHIMGNIQPAIACADRIFEFMDVEEEIDEGQVSPENVKGRVEFRHVQFGYVEGQTILKDFSASIEPGMKVAIVGPTGAGKSTLINLLMRFYEMRSGEILIDGVSVKDMPRRDLHNIFSMVLQETWTFEGSIRDNIIYSTENVSEEDLALVLEESGLRYMVSQLPGGVDTLLSEGSSVSAGQKQLITIARAMLKNASIMILDEATSSVDTRTEKLIQSAIDKMTKGHTSFVIAHRLSTIRNADIIFVLKDGDIIETGSHRELLEKGGFYSELYRAGMEGT